MLASMLARRPLVGVAVEAVRTRGRRRGWRHDPTRRRRYQQCSAVFLAKDVLASTVLIPLYLNDALLPLGVTAILLAGPASGGACAYLCWRILRRPVPGGVAHTGCSCHRAARCRHDLDRRHHGRARGPRHLS